MVEYAGRALTAEPDNLVVLYGVALSHARLGDFDRARANLQNLVRLGYPSELIARDANFDGIPFHLTEEP